MVAVVSSPSNGRLKTRSQLTIPAYEKLNEGSGSSRQTRAKWADLDLLSGLWRLSLPAPLLSDKRPSSDTCSVNHVYVPSDTCSVNHGATCTEMESLVG